MSTTVYDPMLYVDESTYLESRRCCKIKNLKSGISFERTDEDLQRWELLFDQAYKHPDTFRCEYDRGATKSSETGHRFTRAELENMNGGQIRHWIKMYGLDVKTKIEAIPLILQLQDEETE